MRTFFEIVLGILFTVLKASLHALASVTGVLAFCVVLVLAGVYAWRRRSRAALAASLCDAKERAPISIER